MVFANELLKISEKSGEISLETSLEELMIVSIFIQSTYMITKLYMDNYEEDFSKEKARRIAQLCLNAVK